MNNYHFFYGGFLSNWYPAPFTLNNVEYNCVEQYMMASKARVFGDFDTLELIMRTDHPRDQKALGRKVKNFNANIWNSIAKDIVYLGCLQKFLEHDELLTQLLSTKGLLVEASPYDKIWGIGLGMDNPDRFDVSKWKGTNWLGHILTNVRKDFI